MLIAEKNIYLYVKDVLVKVVIQQNFPLDCDFYVDLLNTKNFAKARYPRIEGISFFAILFLDVVSLTKCVTTKKNIFLHVCFLKYIW